MSEFMGREAARRFTEETKAAEEMPAFEKMRAQQSVVNRADDHVRADTSPVFEQIHALHRQIGLLNSTVEVLSVRLMPVLGEGNPNGSPECDAKKDREEFLGQSETWQAVNAARRDLAIAIDNLRVLYARLEV